MNTRRFKKGDMVEVVSVDCMLSDSGFREGMVTRVRRVSRNYYSPHDGVSVELMPRVFLKSTRFKHIRKEFVVPFKEGD